MTSAERMAFDWVQQGILRIDADGNLWRHREIRNGRLIDCTPRLCAGETRKGYLRFMFSPVASEKTLGVMVHRLAYIVAHNGVIDDELLVDHIDFNKKNNRPDNLQQLTNAANCQRSGKLLPEEIQDILSRPREQTNRFLAHMFGCSESFMGKIRNRRCYSESGAGYA